MTKFKYLAKDNDKYYIIIEAESKEIADKRFEKNFPGIAIREESRV